MDWTTVIKNLHDESVRDASRSQDALNLNQDQRSALVFSLSSIVCNRVAKALEAGLLMGMSPIIEAEAPKTKKGRTGKTPKFIGDSDFKPKRGRPRKVAA